MTTKDFFIYFKESLNCVENITFKKMMGEYLLYYKGILVGGLYDNRFLIKKTELSKKFLDGVKTVLPYEGSKTYMYEVDIEEIENKLIFFERLIAK